MIDCTGVLVKLYKCNSYKFGSTTVDAEDLCIGPFGITSRVEEEVCVS